MVSSCFYYGKLSTFLSLALHHFVSENTGACVNRTSGFICYACLSICGVVRHHQRKHCMSMCSTSSRYQNKLIFRFSFRISCAISGHVTTESHTIGPTPTGSNASSQTFSLFMGGVWLSRLVWCPVVGYSVSLNYYIHRFSKVRATYNGSSFMCNTMSSWCIVYRLHTLTASYTASIYINVYTLLESSIVRHHTHCGKPWLGLMKKEVRVITGKNCRGELIIGYYIHRH